MLASPPAKKGSRRRARGPTIKRHQEQWMTGRPNDTRGNCLATHVSLVTSLTHFPASLMIVFLGGEKVPQRQMQTYDTGIQGHASPLMQRMIFRRPLIQL